MGPVTYPDGSALTSTALTISPNGGTFGEVLQPLTMAMMGLTPDADSDAVRLDWPAEGQPFQTQNQDVCYIAITPKDDDYNKIRDRSSSPFIDAQTQEQLNERWTYTRVSTVLWVFYGPNAMDLARALRSALMQDFFTLAFSQSQLFPVSEIREPIRAPEKINSVWYERADLECDMYEFVTENIVRQTITSAEVIVTESQAGVIADLTIAGQEVQEET